MDGERWRQIERIFHEALGLEQQARASFLERECPDRSLREEIEELLTHDHSGGFLNPEIIEKLTRSNDRSGMATSGSWAGSTASHYQIGPLIGSGGMGEVYRARDLKLGRDVAIKRLPEKFGDDPERLARLEREARVLASLNHHNVAGIFGLEEWEGSRFLVLELVEGETLEGRLKKGPLRLQVAVEFAIQVADALEAAHEKGIVHRDLKPANIKVTPDNKLKVLDFGLAKAFQDEVPENDSGSLDVPFETRSKLLLGTPSYMSPEQARGETVDRRTDIWTFGVVLYEMLAGQRAFPGNSVTERLAAVLDQEPDWSALPVGTPDPIRRLLDRCLQKDPRRRLRDMGDARIELEAAAGMTELKKPIPQHVDRGWKLRLGVTLGVIAGAALLVGTWLRPDTTNSPGEAIRMSVMLPQGISVTRGVGVASSLSLSPDGRRLVIAGTGPEGQRLYSRFLDKLDVVALAGTEGASGPFFSPNGEWIGFYADGRLKRIPKGGGPSVDITAIPGGGFFAGAVWMPDDRIVFGFGACTHLHVVASSGGNASPLDDVGNDTTCHLRPELLPDARTLLWGTSLGIQALDLKTSRRTAVVAGNAPRYAAGFLVLNRDANLLAAPIDLLRTALTGPVTPLVEGVAVEASAETVHYSLSGNGTLAYVPDSGIHELVLIEPNGAERLVTNQRMFFQNPQFSPDGRRVAVAANRPGDNPDIWLYDLNGGNPFRLTFDGGRAPVWTPDGLTITFSHLGEGQGIYSKLADGTEDARRLLAVPEFHWLMGWTPDGKMLGFGRILKRAQDGTSPSSFDFVAEGKSRQILGPGALWAGRLSPDGRWLAYYSLESGHFENYVTRFPEADTKWLIGDGTNPRWSPDGKEIFYRKGNRLEAATIDMATGLRVLSKRTVVDPFMPPLYDDYDVHPDSKTVVIVRPVGNSDGREIVVVLNAFTELNRSPSP